MKETKILKNSEVAQPDSQTEQTIDNFTENSIETLNEALADFWKQEALKRWEAIDKDKKEPINFLNEKLTKITGILTSQIRSKPSSDTPFMAFFRIEDCIDCHNTKELCQVLRPRHKNCEECANSKCKDCEIPVIFRVKPKTKFCSSGVHKEDIECSSWKPQLKKGESVILEGKFSPSENSKRPSFTCYSYQILKDHERN